MDHNSSWHLVPPGRLEILARGLSRAGSPGEAAAHALALFGAAAVPVLIEALTYGNRVAQQNAAGALGEIGAEARAAIPALVRAVQEGHPWVQEEAARALATIGHQDPTRAQTAMNQGHEPAVVVAHGLPQEPQSDPADPAVQRRGDNRLLPGTKTYRNEEHGFEIDMPVEWAPAPRLGLAILGRLSEPDAAGDPSDCFQYGCVDEAFNFVITVLGPVPPLKDIAFALTYQAQAQGHTGLETGTITVGGLEHVCASYCIHDRWGERWNKKYLLIFGDTGYSITATCNDEQWFRRREKDWDDIVSSFRLLLPSATSLAPAAQARPAAPDFMLVVPNSASSVDPGHTLNLHVQLAPPHRVTPDLILDLLSNPRVVDAIKADLARTGLIGYNEVWQLGLITPALDRYDPRPGHASRRQKLAQFFRDPTVRANSLEQVYLARTAELHARSLMNLLRNRLLIAEGAPRLQIPGRTGWVYRLSTNLSPGEFMPIRDVRVCIDTRSAGETSLSLPRFLREHGFPLKEKYEDGDGDPLTAERGGTIVLNGDRVVVIYPHYFLQRRFIDDEGNLVYTGLDENRQALEAGVPMRPSVSRDLLRCVSSHGYTPVLRYRSFPYTSDLMLPLLDTPMSVGGWADLFIDPRGKGKLFIAKPKTEAEWFEMMRRLQQLFSNAIAAADYHLLAFTKDRARLREYLSQKQEILEDYFTLRDWQLS